MRPKGELLDYFYDLADLDERKRYFAIAKILKELKGNGEYIVARLVAGLASPRAAARFGFANALTHTLIAASDEWPPEKLFAIVDEKLDFSKSEGGSAAALGQHLVYSAMINSARFSEAAKEITVRELAVLDHFQYFAMAVVDSLVALSAQQSEKSFAASVWPFVKRRCCQPIASLHPEWLYFVLGILQIFSSIIKKDIQFLNAKGKLAIAESSYADVIGILKKADGCAEAPLTRRLLCAARSADAFGIVYENVVEKWLLHGANAKAYERTVEVIDSLLSKEALKPAELLVIISLNFIQMLRSIRKRKDHQFLANRRLESIVEKICTSVTSNTWSQAELRTLLERLDSVGGGNFDEAFRGKLPFCEKVLSMLDVDELSGVVEEAVRVDGWRVRRLSAAFGGWSPAAKEAVLTRLASSAPRSADLHNTFCNCLDSFFSVKVRAGKLVTANLSEENEAIMKRVLQASSKTARLPECSNRTLSALVLTLNLWAGSTPRDEERSEYLSDAKEAVSIDKMHSDGDEKSFSVLIDLLLSILSRAHRFHRSLVHFVFASLLPEFRFENLKHIFETINLPDDEIMGMKGDDDEDEEGTPFEDSQSAEESVVENEREDATEEESDDEDDDEESEEANVDEEFVGKLKSALGDAAMPSEGEDDAKDTDTESVESTVSDETMFRLDAGLAAAFRQQLKGCKLASAADAEQTQQFRAKCFDLLLAAVSHEQTKKLAIEFILPLFETARQSLRSRSGQKTFTKATSLLHIIAQHRKGDCGEKKAVKVLEKMVAASSQSVNPVLRNVVASISGFLFSCCYNAEEKSVSPRMQAKVEELLERYMTQNDNQVLSELATAPFYKYPQALVRSLERLVEFAFSEQVRIFRRTEALSCVIAFMRKDVVQAEEREERKVWKAIAKTLGVRLREYFAAFNVDEGKPRFFSNTVRLIIAFSNVASETLKERLRKQLGDELEKLCENEALWKAAGKKKHLLNSVCQQACGRNAQAALRHALKALSTSG